MEVLMIDQLMGKEYFLGGGVETVVGTNQEDQVELEEVEMGDLKMMQVMMV